MWESGRTSISVTGGPAGCDGAESEQEQRLRGESHSCERELEELQWALKEQRVRARGHSSVVDALFCGVLGKGYVKEVVGIGYGSEVRDQPWI